MKRQKGTIREYVEALAVAALLALTIRAFVFEAFKIPSGSMIPTLSIGDHIFVNKFIYGVRVPFTKKRIVDVGEPERGDVVVFSYPVDEKKDFIKRVVGLPGDRISIVETSLIVNGEDLERRELEVALHESDKRLLTVQNGKVRTIPFERGWQDFLFFEERIGDEWHLIQYERYLRRLPHEIVVPPGHLFVMGDNRDNSADSREWGFVPIENLKGKAMFVWLSLDKDHGGIRWKEFGRWVE